MAAASGIPAIRPSLPDHGSFQPRFTAQDVERYTARHPHPSSDGVVQISGVEFLNGVALRARFAWGTTISPVRAICLVSWQGTFRRAGKHTRREDAHRAWQVFDALSGDLLLDMLDE